MQLVRSTISMLAVVFASACGVVTGAAEIPEIARDLPTTYAEGEQVFDARLKARFPVGTAESVVIQELKGQGFTINEGSNGRFATFIEKRLVVSNVWNVGWEADNGTISRIWGVYGGRGP